MYIARTKIVSSIFLMPEDERGKNQLESTFWIYRIYFISRLRILK